MKASAGELISVYHVFREWVLTAFRHTSAMRPSLQSMMRLLDVVGLIVKAATTRIPAGHVEDLASRLDVSTFAYLQAFRDAHGRVAMKHKHHELVHLADQLRKDKMLLWCFAPERKHIGTKSVMRFNTKKTAFAIGAVSRMLCSQIATLSENPPWVQRLHNSAACEELDPGARIGTSMRYNDCDIARGNLLFIGYGRAVLMLVVACVEVDDRFCVLGHQCLQGRTCPYSSTSALQAAI